MSQMTEKSLPGVSILKPLVDSVDPSLFQNLETFFTLDYPKVCNWIDFSFYLKNEVLPIYHLPIYHLPIARSIFPFIIFLAA